MRKSYRAHQGSRAYWQKRWDDTPADDGGLDLQRYPGRYAEWAVSRTRGRILEAGCGAGRVLINYHERGREIVGIDFISEALRKIYQAHPDIPLATSDICRLPFAGDAFEAVLAFGLYHSLETGIDKALAETYRVMQPGGLLVASMRVDNIQNRVTDFIEDRKQSKGAEKRFHKWNMSAREFHALLKAQGFRVRETHFVENMPFFYKFSFFRARDHKVFNERKARAEGYRLSLLGRALQTTLIRLFPSQLANIMVVYSEK